MTKIKHNKKIVKIKIHFNRINQKKYFMLKMFRYKNKKRTIYIKKLLRKNMNNYRKILPNSKKINTNINSKINKTKIKQLTIKIIIINPKIKKVM